MKTKTKKPSPKTKATRNGKPKVIRTVTDLQERLRELQSMPLKGANAGLVRASLELLRGLTEVVDAVRWYLECEDARSRFKQPDELESANN
jgi:hypothetical protein